MYANVENLTLGELLALLPDQREADELEAEMDDAIEALLQAGPGYGDAPEGGAPADRLNAATDHIAAAAKRVLMDGTAALGNPPRRSSRRKLSPEDKLDLLPPFTAAPLRAELKAAFAALNALPIPLSPEMADEDYLEAMFRTAAILSEIDTTFATSQSATAN